jgi:hypothetical protein
MMLKVNEVIVEEKGRVRGEKTHSSLTSGGLGSELFTRGLAYSTKHHHQQKATPKNSQNQRTSSRFTSGLLSTGHLKFLLIVLVVGVCWCREAIRL